MQFFTVGELNKYIRDVIVSGFPSAVWVCGEIQGLRVDSKGHSYFELCENEDGSHNVKAKIKASIWNTRRVYIDTVLSRVENGFSLKDDIQVKFLCKVDFWQKGGTLSLSVENVDPTYTMGKIAQQRQKLIALLKAQGILEKNKQLALSPVPLKIGLVTSMDSAAYNDFMDELKQSGFGFQVFLANAVMQGKTSEASVVAALKSLIKIEGLDAVVITRGGGSIAELSCFDSEPICRTIAAAPWPVITGIGHEINTTVTDLAAHTFAKTPTAVAQFLVGRIESFRTGLDEMQRRVLDLTLEKLGLEKSALKASAAALHSGTIMYLRKHRDYVSIVSENLKRLPVAAVKNAARNLKDKRQQLLKTIQLNLVTATTKMSHYQKLVSLASPANTLKRGFSITRTEDGRVVKSSKQLAKNVRLTTEFVDGTVTSEVV
jgi:exodeoxyribonuclease VII large subunit